MSEVPPRFDDGKDADALRTIGEVSKALGIRQHVLRYWEEQFPALSPIKRSGGRRYYRPEDVRVIVTIDRLVHREGYTLRGARKAIASLGLESLQAPAEQASDPQAAPSSETANRLGDIRRDLAAALSRA